MLSFAPAVEHLVKNILQLNDDKIDLLYRLKYMLWSDITWRRRLTQLDKELKNKDMSMTIYKGLRDWLLYYNVHLPAIDTIINLDDSIFENENMDKLECIHRSKIDPESLPSTPAPATAPTTTTSTAIIPSSSFSFTKLDLSTTKPENVNTVGFLKYATLHLRNKDDIIILYCNIYQQGSSYDIHVWNIDDATNVSNAKIPSSITEL